MGHRAFVQHCFGVIVDRDLAKQVHEHLIAQLRSAGCSDEAIYEDGDRGDVSHCVIVELLADHLDAAWGDASMLGLGAATSSQETQWFGELQCNAEIESYALAFPVDKPLPNSSEIAKLWQSTFGDELDSLGISLTPAWQTVAQIS